MFLRKFIPITISNYKSIPILTGGESIDLNYWLKFFFQKAIDSDLETIYIFSNAVHPIAGTEVLRKKGIRLCYLSYSNNSFYTEGICFDISILRVHTQFIFLMLDYDIDAITLLNNSLPPEHPAIFHLFSNQIVLKKIDHIYRDSNGNCIITKTPITNTSFILEGFNNHIVIGSNNNFNGATFICKGNSDTSIGDDNTFYNANITVLENGMLSINNQNRFPNTSLFVDRYASIEIHNNCHTGNTSVIRARYHGHIRIADRLSTDSNVRIYAPLNTDVILGCDCLLS